VMLVDHCQLKRKGKQNKLNNLQQHTGTFRIYILYPITNTDDYSQLTMDMIKRQPENENNFTVSL
jgi:hypothetical protein